MALSKTGLVDVTGNELILDADADTSITADTDDQIDIRIAGADDFAFKANKFEVQSGSNIDMNGNELILDADADTSITADTDDRIDFKTGGTDRLQIQSTSGNNVVVADGLTLTDGNLIVASGHGIDFSATGDADSTAGGSYTTESELLDDYEEGRFTPYLHATNVTFGYHHNYGNYTKIGQMVHFTIYFGVSSASGSTTNQAYVWGLPYVCYNGTASSRYSPAVTIGSWYNCDIDTHFPTAYIDPNTEIIKLIHNQDAAVPTAVTADDVSSGFIYLSGSYRIT